jgi:protein TonB
MQRKVKKRVEPVAKSEGLRPHPRSDQKAQIDLAVPAPIEAVKSERAQVAALSTLSQPEAAVLAPGAGSPAGRGESTAGGEARRDEGATQHGGSAMRPAEAGKTAYLQEHFVYIREQILQHLAYPSLARRMGWKGQLTVSFVIGETGRVENLRIIKSSGFKVLDDNALKTIEQILPFPKPPVRAEIVIPIEYRLG